MAALSASQKKAIEVAIGSRKGEEPAVSAAIAGAGKAMLVAVIATPASATAEDCANKINEILNALKNG